MSSDMKDARWGWAYHYAESRGRSYEDFTYPQWQSILDEAQYVLGNAPRSVVDYWAKEFRGEDAREDL